MMKKVALPRLVAGFAIALAMFMTVKVEAVTLTITAAAVCDSSGSWDINYTASVSGNGGVSNPSVNILVDGGVVANGAFVAPAFSFSGTANPPAGKVGGDTVTVSLNVVGVWSNGTLPGDASHTASTTVTLPSDCTPPATFGCTPGYWKQAHHQWPAGYDPDDLFTALPGFANVFVGKSLHQVLSQGGGGLIALGRHTVAALLSIEAEIGYGMSLADLQAGFNTAVATGRDEAFKNRLEGLNEQNCPLN